MRNLLSWSVIRMARLSCAGGDFTYRGNTEEAALKYNESMAQSVYFMGVLPTIPHASDAVTSGEIQKFQ